MACTMPGFPDKYMPFMDEDFAGSIARQHDAVHIRPDRALGPRKRNMQNKYDVEPAWRTARRRVEDRLQVALGGLRPARVLGVMAT